MKRVFPLIVLLGCCAHSLKAIPDSGASTVEISPDVVVDLTTTVDERERLIQAVADARQTVIGMMGRLEASVPLTVFCKTQACAAFFVGVALRSCFLTPGQRMSGARYTAHRPTVVVLRTDALAGPTVAHELIHVEMLHRLRDAVLPAWFHEGLATLVSNNVVCAHNAPRGIDDLRRLRSGAEWVEYTNYRGTIDATYCQAKMEVSQWVRLNGRGKLIALIDSVRRGASFDEVYGPLVNSAPRTREDPVMSISTDLSDAHHPFSLAMWVRPTSNTGVLAHLSDNPVGAGWCTPLIGFDASHRLIAQVPVEPGPQLSHFSITVAPQALRLGEWSHITLTWSPAGNNTLFVNGAKVAETPAPTFFAPGTGAMIYVTWGSYNLGGTDACWTGTITRESFDGLVTGMQIFDRQLKPTEVETLAKLRHVG